MPMPTKDVWQIGIAQQLLARSWFIKQLSRCARAGCVYVCVCICSTNDSLARSSYRFWLIGQFKIAPDLASQPKRRMAHDRFRIIVRKVVVYKKKTCSVRAAEPCSSLQLKTNWWASWQCYTMLHVPRNGNLKIIVCKFFPIFSRHCSGNGDTKKIVRGELFSHHPGQSWAHSVFFNFFTNKNLSFLHFL